MKHSENSIHYLGEWFRTEEEILYLKWFNTVTERAGDLARKLGESGDARMDPYGFILGLASRCPVPDETEIAHRCGATYKQLALIAHRSGMTDDQRRDWYEIAKEVPLSGAHAGHIISRLDDLDEIQHLEDLFARSPE